MIRTHMSPFTRLARPAAVIALLSASACAMAGPYVTSRAGIEYVPPTFTHAAGQSTGLAAEGASATLGNEGANSRGRMNYEAGTVTLSTIVSKVESLSTALRDSPSAISAEGDNRDRAGNSRAPVRYESFQAWWDAMHTDRAGTRPVTVTDTMHRNRSGFDNEPGVSN